MTDKNDLQNFMLSKNENAKEKPSSIIGENKTQKAIDEKKEKELDEAKKNASINLNRNKGNLLMAEGKQFLRLLPFILFGVFVVIVLISKGGDWLSSGLSMLVGSLSGK